MKRSAGVLMSVSSLPGPYGIGTFGKRAEEFIDYIAEMGFRIWQVLPLGTLDEGKSPYASDSAFAGNVLYIDPDELCADGLITESERRLAEYSGSPFTAAYSYAEVMKLRLLRLAYRRITPELRDEIEMFKSSEPWVSDYALYKTLRELNGGLPFRLWQEEMTDADSCRADIVRYSESVGFYIFAQYMFFRQWSKLKSYANEKGISILGDIPVYLSPESCEVWANPSLFKLNADRSLSGVAGVPPDYFSKDGQLWGNPLYNWEEMKKDSYSWWVSRIAFALKLYDYVRIDHFRGLASYWAIPGDAVSAKEGKWVEGPGIGLFNEVEKVCGKPNIVAEDLGEFGDDVVQLLRDTNFPGMRVIQFGFSSDSSNTHLPHNYPKNSIAYAGTHDNNTLLGWLWEMTPEEREYLFKYIGFDGKDWEHGGYHSRSCRAIIETVWRSVSDVAIIAFQDMCGFGRDTRMNIPGIPELNWRYRASAETLDGVDREYFMEINKLFGRCGIPAAEIEKHMKAGMTAYELY